MDPLPPHYKLTPGLIFAQSPFWEDTIGKYDKRGEVSASQLRTFQRCRRKWYLGYYRNLNTGDGDNKPVTVGNLVHKAMEYFYRPGETVDPVVALDIMVEEMVAKEPFYEEKIRNYAELARQMVIAYMEWRTNTLADQGLEIISAEERLSAPLGKTGLTLTGRPDARGIRLGQKVIIDHKTVDSLDEIPKTAQIDGQFKTYHLLEYLQEDPTPIDSVMINMFRRVNPDNPKTKPPYFDRYEVRYNVEEIRWHWYHVLEIAKNIKSIVSRLDQGEDHHKAAPPSPSRQCAWDCHFRMICSMMDDGSNVEAAIGDLYEEGGYE